jgi:hypothetical protein
MLMWVVNPAAFDLAQNPHHATILVLTAWSVLRGLDQLAAGGADATVRSQASATSENYLAPRVE